MQIAQLIAAAVSSSNFHPVVDVECPKALDDTDFVSTDFQHCCHRCTSQGLG